MVANFIQKKERKNSKGPAKLVWEDGQQVMRPDLEAVSQGTPGSLQQQSSYFVGKTLYDIVSETDEIQFSKLKTDSEKYDMIKGMITGVETKIDPPFKVSDPYVNFLLEFSFKTVARLYKM